MRYATSTPLAWARLRPLPNGAVSFECSYSPELTAALKRAIPFTARRWDANFKRWVVDGSFAQNCADLCQRYLGVTVQVPVVNLVPAQIETRLIRLEYLGRTRDKGSDEPTASGWADGGWTVTIGERALRTWFDPDPDEPAAPSRRPETLYGVLLVKQGATPDEIKAAYRRLARVTHPDVNKESDAAEQFRRLKDAYDVLSDPLKRRRYDAGLAFEQSAGAQQVEDRWWDRQVQQGGYRSPLRCGWVLAEGTPSPITGFVVSKILEWQPITNEAGEELCTSWAAGARHFVSEWL